MIADFTDRVRRRLDLQHERDVLRRLGDLPADGREFGGPRIVSALSNASVLTFDPPAGAPAFTGGDGRRGGDGRPGVADNAVGLTRKLTDLWMHLVFVELQIPEELSRADVLAADGAIVLTGGLFHSISQADADALWSYLVTAARDDCDGVYSALRMLTTATTGPRPGALRHHLDHVVPRRDGRFGEEPPGFPELLLAHWPNLEAHGFAPSASLLAFYRGLVGLRELTGPALSRGLLNEALQAAQIARATERLGQALDPLVPARWAEA